MARAYGSSAHLLMKRETATARRRSVTKPHAFSRCNPAAISAGSMTRCWAACARRRMTPLAVLDPV
jgi:hypothetical protein